MSETHGDLLRDTLALVAPGTVLRDGLERILRGRTGAIIVLGFSQQVEAISSGGFQVDLELNAAALRELSKMDGAVIVDRAAGRIRRANVQLLPNSAIETAESGMRHRTAERVAKQTGFPVISVSQSMGIISLYVDGRRHVIEPSESILVRANQTLATLERYANRFVHTSAALDALEIEDLVTVHDVVSTVQLLEIMQRTSNDIEGYVIELGTDGRLISLQHEELTRGLVTEYKYLIEDYLPKDKNYESVYTQLKTINATDLLDLSNLTQALGLSHDLNAGVSSRGLRLLSKIPRLPLEVSRLVVDHWGSLQTILGVTAEELQTLDAVGLRHARTLRDGLSRLAEVSLADRYV